MKKYFFDILRYKYFTFDGRSRRTEFWYFHLWYALVMGGMTMILMGFLVLSMQSQSVFVSVLFGLISLCYAIFALATIIPEMALTVRRLHDAGLTGWLVLLNIIFPGINIIFGLLPPTEGENQFGEPSQY